MNDKRVSKVGELDTFTGKMVSIFSPDPDTICFEDIAHSLSNMCRYNGHCNDFYSVAEHLVLGTYLVPDEY